MIGYIYKTTDLRNGLIYVGKHESSVFEPENYIGSGKILKNIIAKHGTSILKNELLDTADDKAALLVKEQQWIKALDARNPNIGYNLAPGGEGGNLVQGYKWYNDGELNYFFPPDVVPPENLIAGRLLNIDNSNTIWVNNGKIQYHIKADKLADYLKQGFTTGMLDRGPEWKEKVTAQLNSVRDIAKAGIKNFHQKNPHWTNQTSWAPGHKTHNKGKISVTNGITNKFIPENELNQFLQNNRDWYKGNTQKHKEKRKVEQKQIVEALQMQPLSEEEKQSRHILGRLYGPIATCKENTRNGRKYNKDLWTKALNDDVFKEKIASKSLFLELGHPADREETDMTKVCACIPELPKIVDDDLYAYVDILDTNNGRLLKTLCDYGFIPGISSRGSGDIMANDEVDPETFYLETFDIVQLPAVKKARLAMCESFNGKSLKKALTESYKAASDAEKLEIKEALENLEFDLDFPEPCKDCDDQIKEAAEYTVADIDWDNLPEASDESDEVLMEDGELVIDEQPVENIPGTDVPEEIPEETDEVIEDEVEEEEIPAEMPVEEVVDKIEEVAEEIKEVVEADEDQAEAIDEVVEEKKEELLPEEDSKEEAEEADSEDIKDEQPEEEIPEDEDKEENSDDENVEEVEEDSEEADDDGMEEALNNLKEMIRQKGLLENEVKSLKNEKTVSDAEVARLKEELNKYKTGFARVSELASKSTQFEKEVQSLTEQLALKDKELTDLKTRSTTNTALTESVNAHKTQVKSLTEKLDAMQKDLTATETKLNEQKVQYKNKLTEAVAVAKDYKAKYDSVISKYIESRASMLGVKPATIINQLNESYSIEDVDNVCDKLLEADYGFNSFTFGFGNNPRVKVSESKKAQEDDDLSDLYELAGLK